MGNSPFPYKKGKEKKTLTKKWWHWEVTGIISEGWGMQRNTLCVPLTCLVLSVAPLLRCVACEQALLFGRVKQVSQIGELARRLYAVPRACYVG